MRGAERDLRGRLPRLLVWVPAQAQPARCAGRTYHRNPLDKDARRFQEAMCDRLREFSLSLHPEKTRLIEFGRFAVERRAHRRLGKPETFNFLGFTFICGTSSGGQFQMKRKTRRDRMRAKLKEIKEEMRQRR